MLATDAITSDTMPPSHIAATAWRFVNEGSRKCTRYGRVPPSDYHVNAEFSAWRFHGHVHLTGRNADTLGHQFEVVDEAFHRRLHDLADVLLRIAESVITYLEICRPRNFPIVDHDRSRGQLVEALFDDLQGLLHLLHPNEVPSVTIGPGVVMTSNS